MADLRLDDCVHCAAVTHLPAPWTKEKAIAALERGELGCWNCTDADEDGHIACVVLYENDTAVWDGRCRKD